MKKLLVMKIRAAVPLSIPFTELPVLHRPPAPAAHSLVAPSSRGHLTSQVQSTGSYAMSPKPLRPLRSVQWA